MRIRRSYLQIIFYLILFLSSIFKAANTNLLIQFFFIGFASFFLLCNFKKNIFSEIKYNFKKNKFFFIPLFLVLIYIIIQIIPFPIETFGKYFPIHLELINNLELSKKFITISVDPSNTYFQILNFLNLIIIFSLVPALFNKNKDIMNLLLLFGIIGAFHAFFATYWLLIGNPSNAFIIKEFYLNAASGFFINRSNFSIFLLLCAFASLYFINFYIKLNNFKLNFIEQLNSPIIYQRFCILFITIGIVLTLSRAGNFSYILMLNLIILSSFFITKKIFNSVFNTIVLILVIDIAFIGFYFGGSQLIDRYSIVTDFTTSLDSTTTYTRLTMIIFAIEKFKEFFFFGYGLGGFEQIFKIYFNIVNDVYSNHVHNDIVEFLGEFGVVGSILLLCLLINYFVLIIKSVKKKELTILHPILILILFSTLLINSLVDFSLHIPAIQYFLCTLAAIGLTKFKTK